ncbi:unnamed protein product [Owenia fusiformis]|uniref:Uncharacterized protein n=1 Tax=Owenia fusiformis TaxID=6347 RepID=A0A8S4QDH5_OWEFU|nr:unnamed protein product [Owenia fusiformis]
MMSLNVILTIGSLNIHYRGHYGNRMSHMTRNVMLGVFGRLVCKTLPKSKEEENDEVLTNREINMENEQKIVNVRMHSYHGNQHLNPLNLDKVVGEIFGGYQYL